MKCKFNVGDKIRCINSPSHKLVKGNTYTVERIEDPDDGDIAMIYCEEFDNQDGFYASRFEAVTTDLSIAVLIDKAKELRNKTCIDTKDGSKFFPDKIKIYVLEEEVKVSSGRARASFERNGFVVCLNGGGITLPVEELELSPVTITVKLTEDYDAQVYKDKVVVGCQTIPLDKLKELLKLAESLN